MKMTLAALLLALPALGFAADAAKTDNTKRCADFIAKRDAIKNKKNAGLFDKHVLHTLDQKIKALKCEDKAPAADAKAPAAPAPEKK